MDRENVVICITDNHSLNFQKDLFLKINANIQLFLNESNLGFAAGHQQALTYAQQQNADCFLILNNDVMVEKHTLSNLINAYRKNGLGLYGSASVDHNGIPTEIDMWSLKQSGTTLKCTFNHISLQEADYSSTLKVSNVFGHCLMIPIPVIKRHRFMDFSYFLYYEETDYCLRLLKFGIPSYWVGNSRVFHEQKGSTKNNPALEEIMEYYLYRNLFIFLRRHAPFQKTIHFTGRFIMRFLSANIARKKKTSLLSKKHLLGLFHGVIGKTGKYYAPEDYL